MKMIRNTVFEKIKPYILPEILDVVILFFLVTVSQFSAYEDIRKLNFNGWIVFCLTIVIWVALFISPHFIIGKYSLYIYFPIYFVVFIIDIALVFTRLKFGIQLDGDIVGIIIGSSPEEFKVFFNHYINVYTIIGALIAIILIGIIVIAYFRLNTIYNKQKNKYKILLGIFIIIVLMLIRPLGLKSIYKTPFKTFQSIPAVFLITDSFSNLKQFQILSELKKRPIIPEDIQRLFNEDTSIGVIVLGESATKNHWGIYGYEKNTTPCMKALGNQLIRFDDLLAPSSGTSECLKYLFTQANLDGDKMMCTMSQILKHCGYHTALFTHQQRWGRWESMESFAFSGCDKQVYMSEEPIPKPHYDDSLIDYLRKDIQDNNKCNAVYFLHFTGSHFPADAQYPHEHAPFEFHSFNRAKEYSDMSNLLGHYDNSIWFSDKILGEIISICKNSNSCSWVIYLSDHGETPNASSWRYAKDNDLWEIPFVIWFSEEYRKLHPEIVNKCMLSTKIPLQSDQLFWGILEIAGVECSELHTNANFLSNKFIPRTERKIGDSIYKNN